MSFSVDQCKADGWKCEIFRSGKWTGALFFGMSRDGKPMIREAYSHYPDLTEVADCNIRNLPPKPQEPTRLTMWINNDDKHVIMYEPPTTLPYTRIELPWPFSHEHQRWMDAFESPVAASAAIAKAWSMRSMEQGK